MTMLSSPPGGGANNFAELLSQIDRGPTGDTLQARLGLFGSPRITRQARATAPTAVAGNLAFRVEVVSPAA